MRKPPDLDLTVAIEKLKRRDFDGLLRTLIEDDREVSQDVRRQLLRAVAHLALGQVECAQKRARTALERDQSLSIAWLVMARVAGLRGDWEEAAAFGERAVVSKPDDWMTHALLGIFRQRLGQSSAAIESFNAALELDPQLDVVLQLLAGARYQAGDLKGAVEATLTALRLSPHSAAARMVLGDLYRAQGRLGEAEREYRAAAGLQSSLCAPLQRLGHILLEMGRAEEAAEVLRRSLAIDPRAVESHVEIGRCELRLQQSEAALEAFEAALRVLPLLVEARVGAGLALAQLGRDDEAVQRFRAALEVDPNCRDAVIALERLEEGRKVSDADAGEGERRRRSLQGLWRRTRTLIGR